MPHDHRSPQAAEYRKLYKRKRWRQISARQLANQPRCQWCLKRGRVVPATVCHHNRPEQKLNPATFHDGPFTSLCAPCHDSEAKSIEAQGYSKEVGLDGYPIDPMHPQNRGGGG